jgi:zinc transport system ATP-binding protein
MIRLTNLSFSYNQTRPYVLNGLNLTVNKADYISVLGDNGSGKSTLIKLVLNLLRPTEGTIANDFHKTGYVPQRFENLNTQFPITVDEMLNCYRRVLKIRDKNRISKYLEVIGMESFRHALLGELSGGQCQKVFVARALMGEPDLLVLDEPSVGVDLKSQDEIYGLIKNINRNNGITVISVEHNLKAAISNSTLIYHLSGGNGHLCSPDEYMKEYLVSCKGDVCYASI